LHALLLSGYGAIAHVFKALSYNSAKLQFLIVIEKANGNYSAYCPDLPGCVSTGKNREETERNMYQAVEMHVQGMLEDNLPIPESVAVAEYIAVAA
jgi:predicted RNase H-like HicB family nuclease